jgi:hypothetical protein
MELGQGEEVCKQYRLAAEEEIIWNTEQRIVYQIDLDRWMEFVLRTERNMVK